MSLKVKGQPAPPPLLKNAGTAPVVYFDGVPVVGHWNGIIEVELATRMLMPKPDGSVQADMSCVAHLRCSPQAAMLLRDTIDRAIGMLSDLKKEERSPLLPN